VIPLGLEAHQHGLRAALVQRVVDPLGGAAAGQRPDLLRVEGVAALTHEAKRLHAERVARARDGSQVERVVDVFHQHNQPALARRRHLPHAVGARVGDAVSLF
jgi:hypothetical protein